MDTTHHLFMRRAIALAAEGISNRSGGPFGAVIVKDGQIIGEGYNQVVEGNDPTAHAEMVAIRRACQQIQHFHLENCILYTSCEPCPMCLSASYWAHIRQIYFACMRVDAQNIGFDDAFIYEELGQTPSDRSIPAIELMGSEALDIFKQWKESEDHTHY